MVLEQGSIFRRIFETATKADVQIVIAGGAVVDFPRASDIDVFVLSPSFRDALRFADALEVNQFPVSDGTVDPPYEGGAPDEFYRVGKCCPPWSNKPIHVTGYTDHRRNPIDLLETFDLSIHAWAMDETGRIVFCNGSTNPTQPIRIMNMKSTTAARLVKLTRRYFPAYGAFDASE